MVEYIKWEAAYEKCGWYNTVNGKSIYAATKCELASVPSADVAPVRHGRWLDVQEKRLFGDHYFLCSNCKSRNGTMIPFNYCFNCGSRMDLEG